MSVAAGIELDLDLLNQEDYAIPCEHSQHKVLRTSHDEGEAKWYLIIRCPECNDSTLLAVCNKFKELALSDRMYLRCDPGCGGSYPSKDCVTMVQPIGKGKE